MKKTIAILLVLVIGMVGVFAAAQSGVTTGNSTTIQLTTSVDSIALFGVSAATLDTETAFDNSTAFGNAVTTALVVNTQPMSNFKTPKTVGYLSGINNTSSPVYLAVSTTDFTSAILTGETAIALTVTPDTSSTRQVIPAATTQMGTLQNVAIQIVESVPGSIDLAPAAADYTATITIAVSAS